MNAGRSEPQLICRAWLLSKVRNFRVPSVFILTPVNSRLGSNPDDRLAVAQGRLPRSHLVRNAQCHQTDPLHVASHRDDVSNLRGIPRSLQRGRHYYLPRPVLTAAMSLSAMKVKAFMTSSGDDFVFNSSNPPHLKLVQFSIHFLVRIDFCNSFSPKTNPNKLCEKTQLQFRTVLRKKRAFIRRFCHVKI